MGERAPESNRLRFVVCIVVVVFALAGCEAGNAPVLGSGPDADSVFEDMKAAGLPITDGVPASGRFRNLIGNNSCETSRGFVRSDADRGWGLICVGAPASAARRIFNTFNGLPMLIGPLYTDAEGQEIIVFGLGWPGNASKLVADSLGESAGSYLAPR